jgi:hypothetical protein
VTRTRRSLRQHILRWTFASAVAALILTVVYQVAAFFLRGILAGDWPT